MADNRKPKKRIKKKMRHRRTQSSSTHELKKWTNNYIRTERTKFPDTKSNSYLAMTSMSNEDTRRAILASIDENEEKQIIVDKLEDYESSSGMAFFPAAFLRSGYVNSINVNISIGGKDEKLMTSKRNNYYKILKLNQIDEERGSEENMGSSNNILSSKRISKKNLPIKLRSRSTSMSKAKGIEFMKLNSLEGFRIKERIIAGSKTDRIATKKTSLGAKVARGIEKKCALKPKKSAKSSSMRNSNKFSSIFSFNEKRKGKIKLIRDKAKRLSKVMSGKPKKILETIKVQDLVKNIKADLKSSRILFKDNLKESTKRSPKHKTTLSNTLCLSSSNVSKKNLPGSGKPKAKTHRRTNSDNYTWKHLNFCSARKPLKRSGDKKKFLKYHHSKKTKAERKSQHKDLFEKKKMKSERLGAISLSSKRTYMNCKQPLIGKEEILLQRISELEEQLLKAQLTIKGLNETNQSLVKQNQFLQETSESQSKDLVQKEKELKKFEQFFKITESNFSSFKENKIF